MRLVLQIVSSPHRLQTQSFSTLRTERSKALACLERALFYANKVPKTGDIDNLYGSSADKNAYSTNITAIYLLAGLALRRRRFSVAQLYSNARDELRDEVMPDREREAIFDSAEHVWRKFRYILIEASARDADTALDDLCDNWQGLNNICRLLMDEITYLSDRVDGFNSTSKTVATIKYAVWGIGIGAVFSMMSLVISLSGKRATIGTDFFTDAGTLQAELTALEQSASLGLKTKPTSGVAGAPAAKSGVPKADRHQ